MSKQNSDRLRRAAIASCLLSGIRGADITVVDEALVLILVALAEADQNSDNATLKSIGAHADMPRASVARYLKRFHFKGWIAEIANPEDRRRRPLIMTDEGWQVLDNMLSMIP